MHEVQRCVLPQSVTDNFVPGVLGKRASQSQTQTECVNLE